MKKNLVMILRRIFLASFAAVQISFSSACAESDGSTQAYRPEWSSLQDRATPGWWRDAKFGIFIHWGVYAVPSFSPVGTYAEWYGERMHAGDKAMDGEPNFDMDDSDQVRAFHEAHYGPHFRYENFAPHFKAELFDPDQWADVFRRSGAKYVVLTSKHHDGFTLWPSAEADRSWGRPWNAGAVGPKRDLLGELTDAVREAGLKMGVYYSLYEWYNPLYRKDVDTFVEDHLHPQFKDLVTRYNPSVIFADGEWGHASAVWRSEELLAWLYNRPESDEVVVNDRWGKETRHNLGGYYTTEYGAGLPGGENPWEESRGMGTSYGYNRIEDIDDYSTAQRLVLTLVDTVSRGGNLLLNVGPTADGRIPVIMQDRLVAMGDWLAVNGEAIYGTTTWERSVQWGAGKIPEFAVEAHGFVDYDILEQALTPKKGAARKELFFTKRDEALYAIAPKFPSSSLRIKNLRLADDVRIELLGAGDEPLPWKQSGSDILVDVAPRLLLELGSVKEAYTFKISREGSPIGSAVQATEG